jgi:hypothetical protein
MIFSGSVCQPSTHAHDTINKCQVRDELDGRVLLRAGGPALASLTPPEGVSATEVAPGEPLHNAIPTWAPGGSADPNRSET